MNPSNNPLKPAKNVLRSFLADIESVKNLRQCISEPKMATAFSVNDQMPIFDATKCIPAPESFWGKENAYTKLYAEAYHFRSFMHRPKTLPVPEYYKQPALHLYLIWKKEEKELFHRKCKMIPAPAKEITLSDYLQKLALEISEGNEHRDVWIESLRSFLQFIREDTDLDQQGVLDIIFPKKMELRKGHSFDANSNKVECRYILRKVENVVYPIDIFAASDIITNLIKAVLEGRPNSQRSTAEALGFAWLCLAVGSYRLVTRESPIIPF
ncbi:MAG: hypothetical protein WCG10_07655 [Chlamydiota bacterium]